MQSEDGSETAILPEIHPELPDAEHTLGVLAAPVGLQPCVTGDAACMVGSVLGPRLRLGERPLGAGTGAMVSARRVQRS